MWILIIGAVVLACFLAVWLGFVPPPHAATLIRLRNGQLHVGKGQLRSETREHVADILRDAGVSQGFIAITPQNGVAFSRRIPARVHQRLRNVLLNQWT